MYPDLVTAGIAPDKACFSTENNNFPISLKNLHQGSYWQGYVKFKDFSRTNLIVFKDYDTYTNS